MMVHSTIVWNLYSASIRHGNSQSDAMVGRVTCFRLIRGPTWEAALSQTKALKYMGRIWRRWGWGWGGSGGGGGGGEGNGTGSLK